MAVWWCFVKSGEHCGHAKRGRPRLGPAPTTQTRKAPDGHTPALLSTCMRHAKPLHPRTRCAASLLRHPLRPTSMRRGAAPARQHCSAGPCAPVPTLPTRATLAIHHSHRQNTRGCRPRCHPCAKAAACPPPPRTRAPALPGPLLSCCSSWASSSRRRPAGCPPRCWCPGWGAARGQQDTRDGGGGQGWGLGRCMGAHHCWH